jgi:hypothetical protein
VPYRPEITGLNLPPSATVKPPATLLDTGVFEDLAKLQPKAGFVPYHVISPLWSDGAQKLRWVGLPPNGKVKFAATGEWTFPGETVFVKHFQMPAAQNTPARRLETRLLIVDATGKGGYGLTYKWRPDNSNADLVDEKGLDETLSVATADGSPGKQVWHYPGRNECLACHTAYAGFVLGANTRQLNGLLTYPGTRVVDNQLRTWIYLEMFAAPPMESQIANFAQLVKLSDPGAPHPFVSRLELCPMSPARRRPVELRRAVRHAARTGRHHQRHAPQRVEHQRQQSRDPRRPIEVDALSAGDQRARHAADAAPRPQHHRRRGREGHRAMDQRDGPAGKDGWHG